MYTGQNKTGSKDLNKTIDCFFLYFKKLFWNKILILKKCDVGGRAEDGRKKKKKKKDNVNIFKEKTLTIIKKRALRQTYLCKCWFTAQMMLNLLSFVDILVCIL